MIKANFKNVAVSLVLLFVVIVLLVTLDGVLNVDATENSGLRVTVVDLNDEAVHDAEVSVCGMRFFTDNKGLSPTISLPKTANCYDEAITDWFAVNVVVTKDGYVPTVVVNCVIYENQTRRLTVKIYPNDGSDLPFVCYVESPPNEYLQQLISQ